jgi:ribosomal-protein-serine acetyltransferase
MVKKIKNKLIGERIILKITKPSIVIASTIFRVIDENRKHLRPWFPWEKATKKAEDSLKYLFDKEVQVKAGEKVEYGIYVDNEYIGNIGIFDIDKNTKSAEIGFWLSAKFIRNGYVTEAVRILEKEFFSNNNLNRIQIQCDEKNIASSGVAKKCGYIFEGKRREGSYSEHFKAFGDILVFSKLKSDFKKEKLK